MTTALTGCGVFGAAGERDGDRLAPAAETTPRSARAPITPLPRSEWRQGDLPDLFPAIDPEDGVPAGGSGTLADGTAVSLGRDPAGAVLVSVVGADGVTRSLSLDVADPAAVQMRPVGLGPVGSTGAAVVVHEDLGHATRDVVVVASSDGELLALTPPSPGLTARRGEGDRPTTVVWQIPDGRLVTARTRPDTLIARLSVWALADAGADGVPVLQPSDLGVVCLDLVRSEFGRC